MRISAGYKTINAWAGRGRLSRANRGFSLVEVLVAMTILSIGILGIATLTGTALKTSSYSQALTQAVHLAEDRLEALRSVPFDNLELTDNLTARTDLLRVCAGAAPAFNCTPTNTIDVQWSATDFTATGKMHFTWTYVVTYLDIDGNGVANPSADGAKRVDVTVAWTDYLWHDTRNVTLTTIITRR